MPLADLSTRDEVKAWLMPAKPSNDAKSPYMPHLFMWVKPVSVRKLDGSSLARCLAGKATRLPRPNITVSAAAGVTDTVDHIRPTPRPTPAGGHAICRPPPHPT